MIEPLLSQLARWHDGVIGEVIITHNVPEDGMSMARQKFDFPVTEIHNPRRMGFGANHNQAFRHCRSSHFCVLNPDIELLGPGVWRALLEASAANPDACVYPPLMNTDGSQQDSEREVPTPASLWRRHALRRQETRVDWVSAAFWLLPSDLFRRMGGFDEGYYMYCEDADFCLRLQLAGGRLEKAGPAVVHEAARSSRRLPQRFLWHMGSLMRLWRQPVLADYLRLLGGSQQQRSGA
jgi:N-acetylglucosaminyl-diphospho-decaprenol L-rhamnosyltransferase